MQHSPYAYTTDAPPAKSKNADCGRPVLEENIQAATASAGSEQSRTEPTTSTSTAAHSSSVIDVPYWRALLVVHALLRRSVVSVRRLPRAGRRRPRSLRSRWSLIPAWLRRLAGKAMGILSWVGEIRTAWVGHRRIGRIIWAGVMVNLRRHRRRRAAWRIVFLIRISHGWGAEVAVESVRKGPNLSGGINRTEVRGICEDLGRMS